MTCNECGAEVIEAGEVVHRCDPARIVARLRLDLEEHTKLNVRLADLGLAQARYWSREIATVAQKVWDARDVAWEAWTHRPPPRTSWAEDMDRVFETWRKDGWRPKSERDRHGKGEDKGKEEEHG